MVGAAVLVAGGFLLSSRQRSQAQDVQVGGYEAAPVTAAAAELLVVALEDEANYAESVVDRVCVANITSLSEQVVAGMNYRFSLTGSPVETATGWCAEDSTETVSSLEVTIFESLTGSLQVTGIEYTSTFDSSFSGSGSGSSYDYSDVGYGYFDSSVSGSGSGSITVGGVGYVGDEADSDSASGSVEFGVGSYSYSSSGSGDNETISAGDL